ncbi:nuclear transport factor 2 family protein [Deinococcus sp.]|uniref:nuclear transport factor 2 family protein n=1 Tax=Deinococcus sp. TaxID=47478 RepID=UPI003C79940B
METVDIQAALTAYAAAWNEPDERRRQELIEHVWCEEGVYQDHRNRVVGCQALREYIHAFKRRYPDLRIELTGEVLVAGEGVSFTWRARDPEGLVWLTRQDTATLTRDGKLQSVSGVLND